ncbi:MAG: MraY family glycosyltransferase, partial [Planctomycetota bacterium]
MSTSLLAVILAALAIAGFVVSIIATGFMVKFAPKIGLVDQPGHRKIHHTPKPLGGGFGIAAGLVLPMLLGLGLVWLINAPAEPANLDGEFVFTEGFDQANVVGLDVDAALVRGAEQQAPLLGGFLLATLGMFLLGLVDDRKALGPFVKLGVQLAISTAFVALFPDVRLLTVLGTPASIAITVLWIAGVTNAFNFLDNMDGLSSGVAAVCTLVFLAASLFAGQLFIPATLALFLGSLLGFLVWNFPPAKIFMGDSGSLLIGFVLGVLTARTTYVPPGVDFEQSWYGVFVPLIVLAVPLYDMTVVSVIRIANGKSPFVGDTNHFSHRLVRRGMSKRTAVLCIWLVTGATGLAALLLPLVQSWLAAWLIVSQTLLILGVVFLLERHPLPPTGRG